MSVWQRTLGGRQVGFRWLTGMLLAISLAQPTALLSQDKRRPEANEGLSHDELRRIFEANHDGWSLDEVLVHDERRAKMLKAAQANHPSLHEKAFWQSLIQMRKSGSLYVESTQRQAVEYSDSLPAAEIACRMLQDEAGVLFDEILTDPVLLAKYDDLAKAIDPSTDSYTLRKAALRLRKSRHLRPELVSRVTDWKREIVVMELEEARQALTKLSTRPGIYIFRDATGYLYIGQSSNLRERLTKHLNDSDRKNLSQYLQASDAKQISLELHIFLDGSPAEKAMIREAYESDLIRTRKPRLNLAP
jgi:predicted GIY-YIG superfamily endonuclease